MLRGDHSKLGLPLIPCRIAIQRLRTLQEKKQSLAKQSRREIALFIEKGKLETARIKTENIINEVPSLLLIINSLVSSTQTQDIYAELLELLELYCEVLSARFGLLDLPWVFILATPHPIHHASLPPAPRYQIPGWRTPCMLSFMLLLVQKSKVP